ATPGVDIKRSSRAVLWLLDVRTNLQLRRQRSRAADGRVDALLRVGGDPVDRQAALADEISQIDVASGRRGALYLHGHLRGTQARRERWNGQIEQIMRSDHLEIAGERVAHGGLDMMLGLDRSR